MPALTTAEASIIQSTAPILASHGNTITTLFYDNLLRKHPSLNNVFNSTNQHTHHQPIALASALHAYASNINDLSPLTSTLELIANKHASLGVMPEQYALVGEELLGAMGDVLGDGLREDVARCWEKAYWQLADVLIGRERELYERAEEWKGWKEMRVVRREKVTDEIASFFFGPVEQSEGKGNGEDTEDGESKRERTARRHLPAFKPGQYISIALPIPSLGYVQARQYSLSSRPGLPYYRITVKRDDGITADSTTSPHPGLISNALHSSVHEGSIVKISHPFGDFFFDPSLDENAQGPIVLLGTGVGITPLLSILISILESQNGKEVKQREITLIHTAKSPAHRPYHGELLKLKETHDSFRVVFFDTQRNGADDSSTNGSSTTSSSSTPTAQEGKLVTNGTRGPTEPLTLPGRMDLHELRKLGEAGGLHLDEMTARYFVCGPTGMMLSSQRVLKELGVKDHRIKVELFGTGGVQEKS